jgi:broad specificity phosphatase PhoE
LNDRGRVQAAEAGRRLAGLVGDVSSLAAEASPLDRTRETMEILRGSVGLPRDGYGTDERFKELTFGDWEGLTWREVRARDARLAAERERDKWSFVPPAGESYAMLSRRVMPAIGAFTGPTLLVSHGGVARVLLAALAGVTEREACQADIWQGRVLLLAEGGHRWV